jgi:hypothetical protein
MIKKPTHGTVRFGPVTVWNLKLWATEMSPFRQANTRQAMPVVSQGWRGLGEQLIAKDSQDSQDSHDSQDS